MKKPKIPIEREHHDKYNVDDHADHVSKTHDDVRGRHIQDQADEANL